MDDLAAKVHDLCLFLDGQLEEEVAVLPNGIQISSLFLKDSSYKELSQQLYSCKLDICSRLAVQEDAALERLISAAEQMQFILALEVFRISRLL